MAYVPTETTYRLVFDDPEFDGLEVVTREGTIDQYLQIAKLSEIDLRPPYTEDMLRPVEDLFSAFGSVLVSWNVERPAGKPVPATAKGFRSLGLKVSMAIVHAWMNAVAGEAVPLDAGGLDLPMEPLEP